MAQQPKIESGAQNASRSPSGPAAARPWRATRPGDFGGPGDVPTGAGFGNPGPDTGYALRLLNALELPIENDEDPGRVRRTAVHLVAARAAANGKAPTRHDVDVALAILGLDSALTGTIRTALAVDRKRWVGKAANGAKYGRQLVAKVDSELLQSESSEVVERLQAGLRPLQA
jgi:hypothetical protein